jgi:hypothetical protein
MAKRNSTPLFGDPLNKETQVPKKITVKKEIPVKTSVKKLVDKVIPPKKEIILKSEPKKTSLKKSKEVTEKPNPPIKKVKTVSKPIIKIEEVEEIEKEDLPEPIIKKKKEIKNDPPKTIKHKLKVGTKVIATFLGSPTKAVIIELSPEGMYKVKAERGTILPRAKHIEGEIPDKTYPSYIIKVID